MANKISDKIASYCPKCDKNYSIQKNELKFELPVILEAGKSYSVIAKTICCNKVVYIEFMRQSDMEKGIPSDIKMPSEIINKNEGIELLIEGQEKEIFISNHYKIDNYYKVNKKN